MDLGSPIPYLLFLHVMGAIVAFGPTYAYSIMGRMAGREPQHANFSTRQVEAISRGPVYPLAIIQGVTGVLLIIASGIGRKATMARRRDHPVPDHAHVSSSATRSTGSSAYVRPATRRRSTGGGAPVGLRRLVSPTVLRPR